MAEGPLTARIRDGIDAFNRHDVDAVLALVTEDVEWQRVDGLPDSGGVIRGREAVRELMQPQAFERMTVEPLEIVEGDGVVLMHGRMSARGAASGVELEVDTYVVYRGAGELAQRVENYRYREDAERAAGLSFVES